MPRAAIRPSSRTTISSASAIVESAVRDDQRRPAAHRLAQADADPRLRRRVDGRGRVVEDEDPRIDGERARDRDALALAARERDAALADHRVVALRQPLDELVRLRERAPPARPPRRVSVGRGRRAMFSRTRRGEEERILRDDADLAAERGERHVADVDAVERHASARDVVEARHERGERRLARAGVADQRDRRAGRDVEIEVLEHGPPGGVLEETSSKRIAPAPAGSATASGRVARPPPARR